MKRPCIIAFTAVLFAEIVTTSAYAAAGVQTGLSPYSYVQDGLVTQFDSIDNEGEGSHNPTATVWQDLVGSASITLQGNAGWPGLYFDSTYETKQVIAGWPQYVRDSLTLETAMRIVKPSSSSSSLLRFIGRASTDCFYLQNGHVYWYFGFEPASARPHSGDFNYIGTISGYSGQDGYGIAFNGIIKDKVDHRASLSWYDTDDGTGWFNGDMYLSENANSLHGHYYAIRFYNRALSAAEMMTNAVIDKLRFFSFGYDGADSNWADIEWYAPESTAATPPTAPSTSTNDYVQIFGSQITVAAGDNVGLMGLSLEEDATLNIPSGARVAVKVLYVNGEPVERGLYSGGGVNGIQVDWLYGDGVMAVAGGVDGAFPTGTYVAPDEDGYYVFGRPSEAGGVTDYHSGAQKWYIRGERTDWENYWFPEGAKLKLVGYVLLKTIPAGVFSEIDLSEAEHILLCEDKAFSDGSALVVPSGVEFRYQPVTSMSYDAGNGNYYLLSVGDSPESGDLAMNGTLRIYGDGGGLLNSQQYTGDVSGTGTIQFGNFNKAARFSGAFNFKGTATGFNNASLLWVDSLDVDASLGDITFNNGGSYTGNSSLNANGIFFGRNGSGETANGTLEIGELDGQARNTALRGGGALVAWGGNTIHVEKLKSALHVVGRPQDLGCTWSWFGSALAVGFGNVAIDNADFIGNIYLSTNVNMIVGDVVGRVNFDYATYGSGAVNTTTLDITNSCNSGASVTATDIAMLPARLSGFTGSVTLTDTATKSYTVPMDFAHGTNALYNTVGCIGSGTLAAAPATGTINVTFDTSATPAEGQYAVVRFTSGGDRLNGWTVLLNGSSPRTAIVGDYTLSLRRDGTGIWVKVRKSTGLTIKIK